MKTLIASSIAMFVFASTGPPAQAAVSTGAEVRPVASDTASKSGPPVRLDDPVGHG